MTVNLLNMLHTNPPGNALYNPAFTGNYPLKTGYNKDTLSLSFGKAAEETEEAEETETEEKEDTSSKESSSEEEAENTDKQEETDNTTETQPRLRSVRKLFDMIQRAAKQFGDKTFHTAADIGEGVNGGMVAITQFVPDSAKPAPSG